MLSIETELHDDTIEIKLAGRLDVKSAREAEEAFLEASESAQNIVLNLAELDYIASAGLRAIKRLRKAVSPGNGTLVVTNVQDDVMDVFEMTGFAAMLSFK